MSPQRETWLKVTQKYIVQMAVITVQDGKVLVDQSALGALFDGGASDPEQDNTWTITYEVMSELLVGQGFRKWDYED